MFGLCTGYYHMYFNKPEYYVIILGLDCAGKTTLLERIKAIFSNRPALPPQSIRPTVGLNSIKKKKTFSYHDYLFIYFNVNFFCVCVYLFLS